MAPIHTIQVRNKVSIMVVVDLVVEVNCKSDHIMSIKLVFRLDNCHVVRIYAAQII